MGSAVVIHSLEHARAALEAARGLGVDVTLMSAPGAAAYVGAAVFRDMVAEATRAVPGVPVTAVLDCGGDPGLALNALRRGIKAVRIDVAPNVAARIRDIAGKSGAVVHEGAPAALDLKDAGDIDAACHAWLASRG